MKLTEKYKKACIVAGCKPTSGISYKALYDYLTDRGWVFEENVWYKRYPNHNISDIYLKIIIRGDPEAVDFAARIVQSALERAYGHPFKFRTENLSPREFELSFEYEQPLPF